jgi:hypothetical protein
MRANTHTKWEAVSVAYRQEIKRDKGGKNKIYE